MSQHKMFRLRFIFLITIASAFGYPQAGSKTRIVGGQDTDIETLNYQAAVLFLDYILCGGAILNPRYVLTAASCTFEIPVWSMSVRVGSNHYNSGGLEVFLTEIFVHPSYNKITKEGDISLVQLEQALSFTSSINPIQLPAADAILTEGEVGIVSGWGYDSFDGDLSKTLQSTDVPIVDHGTCREAYEGRTIVSDTMICAGYMGTGGKDACEYDTGGPLVVDGKVVGIVSWGVDCGHPNFPGVYTNVAKYISYINEIISN